MNEELQSLIDRAMAAGRSPEQIVSALKQNGLDDRGLMSVDSYIKKKSPSDLEGSSSPSDLRPSVSESLSSERVQVGLDESAIKQQKKAIADAAAAQVYTAVAKTGGDLNKIQDKQAFANAYTTYRSMSDDPRAASLPQNPVAQNGQIDFAVVPTLKRGATEYINDLIKQEEDRKAKLGEMITIPVLSEAAAGTNALIGGILKFNEMITGKDSELADFFLDDAATRSRDALIDYGLTEEDISKGLIGNMSEGNIGTGLAIFGSTIVQQLPQLAAVALTGGAGLPLLAASAAGSGYASFEDRSDLSEGEKMLYGIGVGAAEYLAEKLFLGDINTIRKMLGKEGIESLTKKELGDMMFGALPKGVRGVMEEGTEELLTSVAQQTLGKIIAGEEFNPIEIAESAIYGGTLGGSIYLLSRGSGAIVDPENEAKIRGLKNILKRTKKAEEQPDITEAEKEALRRKTQETKEAINALKVKDDELVARMSEEDRVVLKDIQTQIKANMRDIRSAKTDEGVEQLRSELKGNLDKLNQLKNKYAGQEEVGVPSPVAEGEAPIETQPVEGTGQETPEAGGVLQVPVEEGPEEVAPTAVEETPVAEEVKATVPQSNRQFEEEKKQLEQEIVRLMDAETDEISRVRGAIREVQGTDKLATLDGAMVNEGTIERISQYYEPLIENLNDQLRDLLKSSRPEAPVQKPYAEQTDDERIQGLILDSFKNKAFPIIPSIELKSGKFTNVPLGTTEQELASALERGEVPTNDGVIKISDIQSVTGDGRRFERKEVTPVAEPVAEVVTPTVEPTQEAVPTVSDEERQILSDIQVDEDRIENIKEEIELEKGNIKEELDRLKGEIANVRAQKLPADEKRDLIDNLKAQMEDAKDGHDDLIEIYKDEIKALQSDIKKAQKKLGKIRQESTQKAAPEIEVAPDGGAFIRSTNASNTYSDLYSFLRSGLIGRASPTDTANNTKKKQRLQSIVQQFLSIDEITLLRARNILSVLSNFVPETQEQLDLFNKAYIQAENMLEQISKSDKTQDIFKTKKDIIDTISRQRKLSNRQKETLIAVVNSIKSDRLFTMNFQGDESFYSFTSNLLKANEPSAFVHEIGHWGWYNILTPQDRIEYMNYVSQKFMGRQVEGLVFPAQIPYKGGIIATSGANAQDNYQEYFATQFEQWFTNKVGVPEFLERIFDQLNKILENLISLFKEKGYNPDMVKYFDKIIDTTKFSMSDAQASEINKQLEDNQDLGTQTIGETDVLDYNVLDEEKSEELDIRQETMKDKAKKAWRSMWWSDDQRQIRTFKESLSSMLSREGMKIKEFANGLNRLLKGSDQETIGLVSKVMDGSITPEEKVQLTKKKDGELIFSLSNAMREYIDSLSESIVFDPAFSKLSEDLQNTIIDNLGTYLRGTYRFWKDKRFFPGEETIKAAIEEVYNTMYNEKFDELEQLFDVEGLESNIAKLEDQYEQLREDIIEEERKLPAGEKTVEIKAMIANLDALGKELNAARKLIVEQKKVMKELLKTDEMTPENIRAFKALKNSYIDSQLEFLAPAIKDDAKDFVKAYLEEAKKIRESKGFRNLGIVSPSSIKIPNKQFSQRKNLPETIKALLGEERDPIIRFVDSALSLSNIKYKGDMIYKIASQFKGTDFVKNNATRAEIASEEYRIVTDKFSPLNGKYVHKDVFEAITDPQLYSAETAWFQTYLNILLLSRKTKVIYNVPTWRKNLTGGWYTMMANGVINPSFFSDMRRRTELLFDKRTDPETEALLDLMAQYGLLGQGVDANLIGAVNVMYTRPSTGSDMEYLSTLEKLAERGKGIDSWLGGKYASVDDYTKLVVFRSEVESFAVKLFDKKYSELSDSEKEAVHEQAAERVKQSTPTFSRLPPFYYKLARIPLGDFLSFEFEAFRSFTANFANGYEDIQKAIQDNTLSPTQKAAYMKAGVSRLMGTAAVFGARIAVPTILAGLALGDDDDLEDDVKSLRPNWMEGHSIVPTNITKDGMATVYDYSMEDPYGTIFDVVTDPLSFPSHMISMLNPNMAVTFLFNLWNSKDIYGKDIVNSYDGPFTKAYKYGGYTLKSLIVPPFASSALRDELRAYELEAEKYSPSDAVGRVVSRTVIRDYKYDVASQLYYFGQEFATKKEQYSDLSGIARGNRLAQLDEVRKMYKGLINIAIKKGNPKMIFDANKNIKRQFKPFEEAYILYGYEIQEQE
jgi:hypothetical protein